MVEPAEPSPAALLRLRGSAAVLASPPAQLWLSYFALGGDGSPAAVESWLDGSAQPGGMDYCILAVAVHEALGDVGLAPFDELFDSLRQE